MKSNVKVSIIGRVLDDTTGVMFNSVVASGLEGIITDLRDQLTGMSTGATAFLNAGGTHKLILARQTYMVDGTYQDQVEEFLQDGITISITHRRHPLIKIWVPLTTPEQYVIAHIKDSDTYGKYKVLSLKELPRG